MSDRQLVCVCVCVRVRECVCVCVCVYVVCAKVKYEERRRVSNGPVVEAAAEVKSNAAKFARKTHCIPRKWRNNHRQLTLKHVC